jgi:hypothetical protein
MEALRILKISVAVILILSGCSELKNSEKSYKKEDAAKADLSQYKGIDNYLSDHLISKDILGVISLKYGLTEEDTKTIFKNLIFNFDNVLKDKNVISKKELILRASQISRVDPKTISSMLIDYKVLGGEVFFKDNFPHSAQNTFKESNLFNTP